MASASEWALVRFRFGVGTNVSRKINFWKTNRFVQCSGCVMGARVCACVSCWKGMPCVVAIFTVLYFFSRWAALCRSTTKTKTIIDIFILPKTLNVAPLAALNVHFIRQRRICGGTEHNTMYSKGSIWLEPRMFAVIRVKPHRERKRKRHHYTH